MIIKAEVTSLKFILKKKRTDIIVVPARTVEYCFALSSLELLVRT